MLTQQDIVTITGILGTAEELGGNTWFWNIRDAATGRVLALSVSLDVDLGGDTKGTLVSAQTQQGYLELHDVTAFLCIEPDEVMFITKRDEAFSSLVVGSSCTCSLYSNIRSTLLKQDLTELDPSVLMAAMQLSLADSLLESLS